MKTKLLFSVILFSVMTAFPALVIGQREYPADRIQIETGFPPGGAVDILTRGVIKEAKKYLGQEIIITYRPGASGTVSLAHVITTKPDGYNLGTCPSITYTNAPFILDLKFDPYKETIPIIAFAKYHNILTVKSDSPFKTLKDFLEYAKQNPGKAIYGNPGTGTGSHLIMAAIAVQEGIQMNITPFQGDAQAIAALLGGHITAAAGTAAAYVPHIQARALRVIATYDEERLDSYPETPSISELGYPYSLNIWILLYGPKGLPEPVIKKLEEYFDKACQSPAFKELTVKNESSLKKPLYREELLRNLVAEKAKIADLFQKAGLIKK